MTALEKMRDFIASYDGADILKDFQIDFTDQVPANAGLFPAGMTELSRQTDILGNCEIQNQLNFALYITLKKVPGNDDLAKINAEWILDFQDYVQEASFTKNFPAFGDYHDSETISATQGRLYQANEEGTALYAIQISVRYTKKYSK